MKPSSSARSTRPSRVTAALMRARPKLPPGVGSFPRPGGPSTGTVFYFLLPYLEGDNIKKQNENPALVPLHTLSIQSVDASGVPATMAVGVEPLGPAGG